jgi:hypothetical protein
MTAKKKKVTGNGFVFVEVSKLGSEVHKYSFAKGVTVADVLAEAQIDGGVNTVKMGSRTITDFDTKITTNASLVAIPNVKGGC